jgi:hypothetical protein
MIVPFDDLELVYQSLRTLEPPHTHKFPRDAQDCKLGPIQPWDVKEFLRPGRGRASRSRAGAEVAGTATAWWYGLIGTILGRPAHDQWAKSR